VGSLVSRELVFSRFQTLSASVGQHQLLTKKL
jgi:hypothetical protein